MSRYGANYSLYDSPANRFIIHTLEEDSYALMLTRWRRGKPPKKQFKCNLVYYLDETKELSLKHKDGTATNFSNMDNLLRYFEGYEYLAGQGSHDPEVWKKVDDHEGDDGEELPPIGNLVILE